MKSIIEVSSVTEEQIFFQRNTACAMTDLFLSIVLFVLILLFRRIRTDQPKLLKCWRRVYLFLDVSAVLGFLAHFVFTDGVVNSLIWVVLFPLLMEDVLLFVSAVVCSASGGTRPTLRDYIILHAVGAVGVALSLWLTGGFYLEQSIKTLTACALAVALFGLGLLAKTALRAGKIGERIILSAFLPILVGAFFEIKGKCFYVGFYFDQDSLMHLLSTLGLVMMFIGVKKCLTASKTGVAKSDAP